MVSGGIVEVTQEEDGASTFYLPKAHADILTKRAGNANLGVYTRKSHSSHQAQWKRWSMASIRRKASTMSSILVFSLYV